MNQSIAIRPSWTLQSAGGATLSARLIELLVQVQELGSLQAAAQQMGLSYRHAWDLVRQGEAQFQAPLLLMARGKGSQLTQLGEKIVWADRRIQARLKPSLDSLASEISAEIERAIDDSVALLRLHASHGFAIEQLVAQLERQGLRLDLTYGSSTAAAAALQEGDCDAAGFHIPLGAAQAASLAHYRQWLGEAADFSIIHLAERSQGLMVRAGNPKQVQGLADLLRPELRFVNRQVGSGTRLLLETLLQIENLDAGRIAHFEQVEQTHAAVAAYIASGLADAGFGLEPPARQFKLDFIPLARERYVLLCRNSMMASPAIHTLRATLQDPVFLASVASLPGYDFSRAGQTGLWPQDFAGS